MVKCVSLILYFLAPGMCLAAACLDEASSGAAGAACARLFPDLSDTGSKFVQISTRATHSTQAVGATAAQPSANATQRVSGHKVSDAGSQLAQASARATHNSKAATVVQPSASRKQRMTSHDHRGGSKGVSEVMPLECGSEARPLQVMKAADGNGFEFKALNIQDGHYELLYNFPFDMVEGGYAEMNACDVNPVDNILYCVLRADGECYAVRLDKTRIEFVAMLPPAIWSAGSFAYTGEYFVSMTGAELIVVPPLHDKQGYPDKDDARLVDFKKLIAKQPPGFMHTSDSVVVKYNLKGTDAGEGQYFISLFGPKLEIGKFEEGKCVKTWIKKVVPERWDNIYGAGFNFQGKVFFATNRGAGVYAIPFEDIDLDDEEQVVELEMVGLSDASDFNDGVNCKDVPNPWGFAASTNATIEATEAPPEIEPEGVPEVVQEAAPAAPPVSETPVAAAAPPTPAPDTYRRWAWLLLLYAIPIMLCYVCVVPFVPGRFNPFPWFGTSVGGRSARPEVHAPLSPRPPVSPPRTTEVWVPPPSPPSSRAPFFSTLRRSRTPPKPPLSPVPPSSTDTLRTVVLEPEVIRQQVEQPPQKAAPYILSPPSPQAVPIMEAVRTQYVVAAPATNVPAVPEFVVATAPSASTAFAPATVISEVPVAAQQAAAIREVIVPEVREVYVPEMMVQAVGVQSMTSPASSQLPVAASSVGPAAYEVNYRERNPVMPSSLSQEVQEVMVPEVNLSPTVATRAPPQGRPFIPQ